MPKLLPFVLKGESVLLGQTLFLRPVGILNRLFGEYWPY